MVRREAQRLEDIANAIQEIRRLTAGMDVEAYLADWQTRQAVAWTLMIVGEAIKALPPELAERHPGVAWAKWAGLRDFLVHQYFRIDQRRIWRIVQRDMPPLETTIAVELKRVLPGG